MSEISEVDQSKTEKPRSDSSSEALTITEEIALNQLKTRDLPSDAIDGLCRDHRSLLAKSRKVRVAVVGHPRTPRHLSLPMLRQLYTFDLMQVALMPSVASDLRIAAEETLINRLETISSGERTTLAKRASGRVAGTLLLDPDVRVMRAALENPRVTEAIVVKSLMNSRSTAILIEAVSKHFKWHARREIQIALVQNLKTPIEQALRLTRSLPAQVVNDLLAAGRLPGALKARIRAEAE